MEKLMSLYFDEEKYLCYRTNLLPSFASMHSYFTLNNFNLPYYHHLLIKSDLRLR
uniref:Uncharacterized protein n=1 Tax=Arundo donax TaxID=35708 RepID=A0A0A9DI45_ARUDO